MIKLLFQLWYIYYLTPHPLSTSRSYRMSQNANCINFRIYIRRGPWREKRGDCKAWLPRLSKTNWRWVTVMKQISELRSLVCTWCTTQLSDHWSWLYVFSFHVQFISITCTVFQAMRRISVSTESWVTATRVMWVTWKGKCYFPVQDEYLFIFSCVYIGALIPFWSCTVA